MNELVKFGNIESIADLFLHVQNHAEMIAQEAYPDNEERTYYQERNELRMDIENAFFRTFMQYAIWSKPTRWHLDFSEPSGSFGILLVGEYTCLVQVDRNGKVGGHS